MLLGFFAVLFLREIPLRKSNTVEVAQATTSGTNRSRALLGLTLALVARVAQKPEADPQILATLSSAVNGRYPHSWDVEQRGKAVARDIIEPLAITLLASSISNGEAYANGASGTQAETPLESSEVLPTGAFLG